MAPRRVLLVLPALLAAPSLARGVADVPPFPRWIGRTALLRGEGGAARLRLDPDGTGLLAVRLLLFCRSLPVRSWRIAPDGLAIAYSRSAALDASRLVAGEARILPEPGQLLWTEAQSHTAEFEGFAAPDAAGRCG
jgi:hypothetical protein